MVTFIDCRHAQWETNGDGAIEGIAEFGGVRIFPLSASLGFAIKILGCPPKADRGSKVEIVAHNFSPK
jgi:hypothetical protein